MKGEVYETSVRFGGRAHKYFVGFAWYDEGAPHA